MKADTGNAKTPVVVMMNGLDSTKELLYGTPVAEKLRKRGVSVLCVDQPGTGEALRLPLYITLKFGRLRSLIGFISNLKLILIILVH